MKKVLKEIAIILAILSVGLFSVAKVQSDSTEMVDGK